jgi:hypothetical protein
VTSIATILNLVWAFLCAGALVWHWVRESQRVRARSLRVGLIRGLSVFLATLSLFPCISVSDDYARARLQDLASISHAHAVVGNGNASGLLLAVQLEETEHIRPVAPFLLILLLFCLLVILPEESGIRRSFHGEPLGRAPPVL